MKAKKIKEEVQELNCIGVNLKQIHSRKGKQKSAEEKPTKDQGKEKKRRRKNTS